jgi:hypothetical protein
MKVQQRMAGGFKVKKSVTLPVIKLATGVERYLMFTGPMHQSKDTGQVMNGKKMDPATVAEVMDLQTGEVGVLICATVLQTEISEGYPDAGYVGRAFAITMTKVPEKKYNLYSILEIEKDEAQQDAADDAEQEAAEKLATAPAKAAARKGKR